MGEKNIGGLARKIELSLAEIAEIEKRAWDAAWAMAEEAAAKVARIRGCGHPCLECENVELKARVYRAENPERGQGRRNP